MVEAWETWGWIELAKGKLNSLQRCCARFISQRHEQGPAEPDHKHAQPIKH